MPNGTRKQQLGTVVSDRMDKSIVVAVGWSRRHGVYGKARRRITRFIAHDEDNKATLGDVVRIEEARPLSRNKRWRLVAIETEREVAEYQPEDIDPEAGAATESEEEA